MKNNNFSFDAAVFDVDGTLLDSMYVWRESGKEFLRDNGIKDDSEADDLLFMGFEQTLERLKNKYHINITKEKFIDEVNIRCEKYCFNEVEPKKGTREFLEYLKNKNVRMGIATATHSYLIEPALKRTRLFDYFSFVYSTQDLGLTKQKREIFDLCAKKLGSKPQDTAVFEDAYYAMKTAHDAGYKVFGVKDEYNVNSEAENRAVTADIRDNLGDYIGILD